jgi:hypothetical protein
MNQTEILKYLEEQKTTRNYSLYITLHIRVHLSIFPLYNHLSKQPKEKRGKVVASFFIR